MRNPAIVQGRRGLPESVQYPLSPFSRVTSAERAASFSVRGVGGDRREGTDSMGGPSRCYERPSPFQLLVVAGVGRRSVVEHSGETDIFFGDPLSRLLLYRTSAPSIGLSEAR